MAMSPEHREKLLVATREAAAAFVEDMEHIREVLARVDPVRGELRRLSGVLRRLIVNAELTSVSSPRLHPFNFEAPDNSAIYAAEKGKPYLFFGSAGVAAFGVHFRAVIIEAGDKPRSIAGFDPDRTTKLRLDRFQNQHVICLEGKWVSRNDVIKYVANVASGVHSGTPKSPEDAVLSRVRRSVSYAANQHAASISFDLDAAMLEKADFQYTPGAIDPLLLELLATAQALATGEDTSKLERIIRAELGMPEHVTPGVRALQSATQPSRGIVARTRRLMEAVKASARNRRATKLEPCGNLTEFRFTTQGKGDPVLTVSTSDGSTLQAKVSDADLRSMATHFPVYLNNLLRHRAYGQGADKDINVRVSADPIGHEVNNDMFTGDVLLAIEGPSGVKSIWRLKPDAATALGRALLEHAQKAKRRL